MTVSPQLLVWFGFTVPGLITAVLSLRRALFVLHAAHVRHASNDVATDTRHVASSSTLLMLGWLVDLALGVLGVLSPPPAAPVTAIGTLILWGLLTQAGVWSVMTVADYLYTRQLWQRAVRVAHARTVVAEP